MKNKLLNTVTALFSRRKWQEKQEPEKSTTHEGNPIYFPKRTKLKGYQKENKKSTFNKNR